MQVPTYEQSVGPQTTQLKPAQTPGIVAPEAFGSAMADVVNKSIAEASNNANILVEHIKKQNEYKSEAMAKDAANQLAIQQNNLLYSTDTKEIQDGQGNKRTVTAGILNRKNFDAHNSLYEYEEGMRGLINQYGDKFKNNPTAARVFKDHADTYFMSGYNSVNEHEAKEWRNGQNNVYSATSNNLVNQAELAQNTGLLLDVLDKVKKNSNSQSDFNGDDAETRLSNQNKVILKATEKAVIGKLRATGDTTQARELLDSVKDSLPKEVYDQVDYDIEKTGETFRKMSLRATALDQFNNRASVIKGIASGRIDLTQPGIAMTLAGADTELGTALKEIQEDKGSYIPKLENESYQNYVKEIFASGSKEKISNILIDALHAKANKEISQDKLNILIDAALNQAKILPIKEGDDIPEMPPEQAANISGVKMLGSWSKSSGIKDPETLSHYLSEINKGTPAKAAISAAIKHTVIKHYPETASLDEPPNMVVPYNDSIKLVYPKTTTVAPDRVYNPKTKRFEANKDKPQKKEK